MAVKKIHNPFITGIHIPDSLFCERDKKVNEITKLIENGNNVVLKSKRRIGKSSLITHILNLPEIKRQYNTFYLDIYGTKNADEFAMLFQSALMKEPWMAKTKIKETFSAMIKSAQLSLGSIDTATGTYILPSIGLSNKEMPRLPLADLFDAMEASGKPCIAVFDEFQQIKKYPENFAATIRSFVQKMNNTKFIFSGSSKHLLALMFNEYGQPFYKSAWSVDLAPLPLETYKSFCKRLFVGNKREIDDQAVDFIYELFSGETMLMQQAMNNIFSNTQIGEKADIETCREAVNNLLRSKDSDYKEILDKLQGVKERNMLFYIAYAGIADKVTSSAVIKEFDLQGTSQVQNALKNLGEDKADLIEAIDKTTYVIKDRLLELWLAERMDILENKLQNAPVRYNLQIEIENKMPTFKKTKNKRSI